MRRLPALVAATTPFALGLALAATVHAAPQASGWKTYRNPALGFSVETPAPPKLATSTTPTPAGLAPTLNGIMDLGPHGVVMFTVVDATAQTLTIDADKLLDGGVQGELASAQGILDSVAKITVDGAPGREAVIRTATTITRSRLILKGKRYYILVGVGRLADGAPPEFARFEKSLKLFP